eukprot:2838161-Pyramimonas_sp.AAC.1
MIAECQEDERTIGSSEPLPWMLRGGPGTGKSFVVETLRKHVFERVMGWEHGLDFQVAALQATNASSLDGHTLHAASGMTPHGASTETSKKRGESGAKK